MGRGLGEDEPGPAAGHPSREVRRAAERSYGRESFKQCKTIRNNRTVTICQVNDLVLVALVFTSGPKTQITALSDADGFRCLENLTYLLQCNWSKTCFPCFSGASTSQSLKFCNLLVYTASSKSESSLWMLWCLSPHSSFSHFFPAFSTPSLTGEALFFLCSSVLCSKQSQQK